MAISQDEDGFMWFGTRDGLNQFDGKEFRIFRSKNKDSTTISNNDILDLEVDENGDLWVGTTNGLNRYNKELKIFQRYYKTTSDSLSLVSNTIREILVSGKDVWIGTSNGLCVLDQSTGVFHNFIHRPDFILNNQIMELSKDNLGNIWIGTNTGLVKVTGYSSGQLQFVELADFKNVFIQSITKKDNKLFVGTKGYGIKVLDLASNKIIDEIKAPELANNDIRALEVDNDGNLWVGSYNGLNIINNQGNISHLTNDESNPNSLSRNTIKSIFLDQQGSIWVGTYYGGINYWNDLNFNFKYIEKIPSGAGLSYSVVSAMESYQEDLYIATEGGGITVRKQDKTYEYINSNNSELPSNNVKALLRDKETLLIGTFNAGLSFYDLSSNSVRKKFNTENALPHNSVYGLAKSNNYYWIGTFGGGLARHHLQLSNTDIFQKTSKPNSLSDDQVRVVFSDKLNGLWVGTQNGLNYAPDTFLHSNEISFQKYLYNEYNQSGEDILCIFQDSKEVIWVGTKENGLYRKNNNRFQLIELFEDLPNASNTVHSIEEGENGDLWISSNNGILKYNPASGQRQLFEKSDGLIPNEFNSNSSFKDDQKTIYFGGPMGVSYFSPSQLKTNTYAPKVVLTDFYLADEKLNPLDNTGILARAIAYTETIKLDYDQTTFSLRFAMPNYVISEKNHYAYRLKGLSEWTNTTANTASYTIQKAGTYVFEVKGQNNDDVWSEEVTSLTIRVKPAPWRTPWAFGGYALAILGAIYFLTRTIQIRGQLERDLMLEHDSNEREKVLNKMKLQFFTNISHEFRTPLTLIVGPLQKIIQDYRGSSKLYKQILMVEKNAHQLFKLINQLMDFRKLENNESKLVSAQGNIVKFTEEVFISFQSHAKNIGYNFTFSPISENIQVYYDRDKMERILYNLVSNSFKFTPQNGNINISIKENSEQVIICIADTGIGIDAESIPRIFDRFYQTEDPQASINPLRGTGIGLALVKGLIELHHGKVEVESDGKGKGTTFRLFLPKGKAHLASHEIISNFRDSENLELYTQYLEAETLPEPENNFDLDELKKDKKLLIVEDNHQLRKFITTLLEEYTIFEASNGKEGLKIAVEELPDLILSDIMMPEMNGIELCSQVKNDLRLSHIPVILVTARTSLLYKYEGLESGADDYINKPFDVRELKIKIHNMIKVVTNLKNRFKNEKSITPSDVTLSSVDEELMQKAIKIVDNNIANEFFDVSLFCKELGVSRTMLFTKLKAWTNLTPNEFIYGMRMKRAAQLLETGKSSVSRVCFAVGYKNPKYFSKSFQKYHEISPSKYSEKFKQKSEKSS